MSTELEAALIGKTILGISPVTIDTEIALNLGNTHVLHLAAHEEDYSNFPELLCSIYTVEEAHKKFLPRRLQELNLITKERAKELTLQVLAEQAMQDKAQELARLKRNGVKITLEDYLEFKALKNAATNKA